MKIARDWELSSYRNFENTFGVAAAQSVHIGNITIHKNMNLSTWKRINALASLSICYNY